MKHVSHAVYLFLFSPKSLVHNLKYSMDNFCRELCQNALLSINISVLSHGTLLKNNNNASLCLISRFVADQSTYNFQSV